MTNVSYVAETMRKSKGTRRIINSELFLLQVEIQTHSYFLNDPAQTGQLLFTVLKTFATFYLA
jgi:hypothetical protein